MVKTRKQIAERNSGILEEYLTETKNGVSLEDVIINLSNKHGIGKFYVRTILKDQGIEIERKTEYERTDKEELKTRDGQIIELFNNETDPDDIAEKFGITSTRVRQILRSHLGKSFKVPKLQQKLEDIKKDLNDGVPYENIVNKYGKNTIKQIKYNLGFNAFKKALEYKIKDIVKLAKKGVAPKDIAKKHNVTLNYTYMILHNNGIRSKISKEDKEKRDKNIVKMKSEGKNVEEIAKEHEITSTMVRIILSNFTKKTAIKLKSEGKSLEEIADKLKVSKKSLAYLSHKKIKNGIRDRKKNPS